MPLYPHINIPTLGNFLEPSLFCSAGDVSRAESDLHPSVLKIPNFRANRLDHDSKSLRGFLEAGKRLVLDTDE